MRKQTSKADLIANYGLDPDAKPIKSYLRLEKRLTAASATNKIAFDLKDSTVRTANERRLNLNDMFIVMSMGIYVYQVAIAGADPTDAEIVKARLRTSPNPLVFTAAGAAESLMAIYNGYSQIIVNNEIFAPFIENYQFYRVGTAQKGQGPAVITQEDEWQGPNYGMADVMPTMLLNGSKTNEVNIILGAPTTFTPTTATALYVACLFKGFLIPNGAQFNKN